MPSKSLYAQYIEERESKSIIEDEHGFATYFYTADYCYIEDIFVLKEHRKSGIAAKYADLITKEARGKGIKKLVGSVAPKASGSTQSVQVLLAYGFNLDSADSNLIYFIKNI